MEHLGGLIHRMPVTAFAFLTGCIAISALPPLNGFVSEWLTFQAILLSPALPSWGLKIIVPAVGAMLALSAALAAACFVKAFGVTFLGRPRTPVAAQAPGGRPRLARRHAGVRRASACWPASCPASCIDALAPVTQGLLGAHMPVQAALPWLSIVPIAESRSSYNGLLVFVFIALATLARRRGHPPLRLARGAPRAGLGLRLSRMPTPPPSTPPTASPSRSAACSARRCSKPPSASTCPPPATRRPARLTVIVRDLVWEAFYAPISASVSLAADRLNRLQFLTIRQYLSLVFAALVALLLVVSIWP